MDTQIKYISKRILLPLFVLLVFVVLQHSEVYLEVIEESSVGLETITLDICYGFSRN